MIFRKNGIEFDISPLFFIITSILLFYDRSGYMSFSVLFSLLHEMGHISMMFILKKPPKSFKIKFYGFEIISSSFTNSQTLLISFSGPLINIIFAIISLFFSKIANYDFSFIILINIVIAGFNLLPIISLDGGDIIAAFLSIFINYYSVKKIVRIISISFSVLIIILGIIVLFYGNIGLIFIGIYLFVCNLIKSD